MSYSVLIDPTKQTHERIVLRNLFEDDKYKICSWVRSQKALNLVSGDNANCLTLEIFNRWIHQSNDAFVASSEPWGEPLGFCTISQKEAPNTPPNGIELCHLIIAPTSRYLFVGQFMCRAIRESLQNTNYMYLYGRVVPTNRFGLVLCRELNAEEFTDNEEWTLKEFRWFRLKLNSNTRRSECLVTNHKESKA